VTARWWRSRPLAHASAAGALLAALAKADAVIVAAPKPPPGRWTRRYRGDQLSLFGNAAP